jgi:hypothetical protein
MLLTYFGGSENEVMTMFRGAIMSYDVVETIPKVAGIMFVTREPRKWECAIQCVLGGIRRHGSIGTSMRRNEVWLLCSR